VVGAEYIAINVLALVFGEANKSIT